MAENIDDLDKLTYEEKVEKLNEILTMLDNSETPIDKLAEDVKQGARLIKELDKKPSRRRHTNIGVTGVQTCALPICSIKSSFLKYILLSSIK